MIQQMLSNSFTRHLKCALVNFLLMIRYRKRCLSLGSQCQVHNTSFGKCNTISNNVFLNSVEMGDYTYIAWHSKIQHAKIGRFCSIGPEVLIGLGKHPSSGFVSTHPLFYSVLGQSQKVICDKNYFEEFAPVKIENDVWIGARAIVLDGVILGNGCIVAAGSVVTKDVEPYAVVGGVPAKLIQFRFSKPEIEFLLRNKWWDKDFDFLEKSYKYMHDLKDYMQLIDPSRPCVR